MHKKKEEVKRLKALKMKEIRSKLERIGKEGGKQVDGDSGMSIILLFVNYAEESCHSATRT